MKELESDWQARNAASLARSREAEDKRVQEAKQLYDERRSKEYEVQERNKERRDPKKESDTYRRYAGQTSSSAGQSSSNPESQTRTYYRK